MKPKSKLRSFLLLAGSSLLAISHSPAATYYWDNNGATNGFGPAGGSWATGASLWNADTDGNPGPSGTVTTLNTNATTDAVNFGNGGTGLGAGTITVSTVNSGNMTFASGSGAIILSGGTITLSTTQTTTVDNASNTIESILAGAATSLTKAGSGSLLLTGANTYSGSTIVNAGTLNLGGGTAIGSLASTVLTLGGGAFHYTRNDNATKSFTTTNINSRSSAISVSAGNTLNLGAVSRGTGGTFDFSSTGAGILSALATSNVSGIMPGLTLGDSWAVGNGDGVAISALGSYTLTSVALNTGTNYTGNNIDVDSSVGTLDAAITANSLRFSSAAATTLDLASGTNTISSSGILVGSAVGANLSTISGGTLTGSISKDLSIIQNNSSGGLTISSAIANNTATSITKSGTGLLTLAGNNTFTGGLNIHAGSVALGNAGALNSTAGSQNAVTFTGGSTGLALKGNSVVVRSLDSSVSSTILENASVTPATLTIGNSLNLASTYNGLLQDGTGGGALGLIKAGTGTLTLSNSSNSYTGGTFINAGTLQPSAAALGTSANTITFTGNGALQPVYGSNPTFTQGIVINPGVTGQLNAANQFYHHTVSGVVSGSGTLLIAGTDNSNGNVTLSNTGNSHTGIIRIGSTTITGNLFTASIADGVGAGAVQLGGTSGAGNLTFSGTGAAQTFANRVFTLSGTTGGGTITNNGPTANIVTISQNLAITANGAKTLSLGGSNTGANTFSGSIGNSGSGATSITKSGGGTWVLGNVANTYAGITTISGGILEVTKLDAGSSNSSIGASTNAAGNLVLNGGTLRYTGAAVSTDRLFSLQVSSSIDSSGTGAVNFTNTGAMGFNGGIAAKTLTLTGTNTGNNTIAASIGNNTAATSIAKTGIGTWVLSGTNSATGTTNISGGGTLVLDYTTNNDAKLGSGALTLTSGGNVILRAGSAFTQPVASLTLGTATLGGNTSISRDNSGTNKIAFGAISRTASAYATLFLAEDNLATTTSANVNGILTGGITVGSNWAKNDGANNIVGLSGLSAGNYTDLSITAGGSSGSPLNNNYQLTGNKTATGEFVLGSLRIVNSASNDTLNMAGFQLRVSPLTGTLGNGAGGGILYVGDDGANTTNNTYTITGASGLQAQNGNQELIINTYTGTLNVEVPLTMGSQGLAKTGAGKLRLSGASTYTGPTFVNQGTLLANNTTGNGIGTGAVTVHRGAALGGTGTVGGSTTIAAGGGLTFDLTTASGSHDKLELASGKSLTFSGTSTLTITSSGGTPGSGTYTLLTAPGGITGSVPTVILPGGWTGTASIAGNDLVLNVTSTGSGATYANWASLNGASANLGDDHDNDGVDNGTEYFMFGPTGNSTGFTALPGVTNNLGTLSVTWTKAGTYTGTYGPSGFEVQTSSTLAAGTWTAAATSGTPNVANTVYINGNNVTYTFPAGTKNFARLKVTGP